MNAVEILSISLIVVLLATLVLIAALFLKAQQKMLEHADRLHERSTAHEQKLLDRLMAMDFQTFKSYELAQNAPHGSYEEPDVEEWADIRLLPGLETKE